MTELYDCRVAFAETLTQLAAADSRIIVVVNDSVGSSNLGSFAERFPDRVINVGIAEQTMVGLAAGLASSGWIPFVCGAACFLTGRATEQIKVDVAYSQLNVKLCGMAPGMAYGELGPTHHSIEDLSWMRALPGLDVIVPADPIETAAALTWMAAAEGGVYLRVLRMKVPRLLPEGYEFRPGKGRILRQGTDATIISNGVTLAWALNAADTLADEGISTRVVDMASVKPLDNELVLDCAAQTGRIVTVEEAQVSGGMGAAVASLLAEHLPVPMRILGAPDEFAPTGSEKWVLDHWGVSASGMAAAVRELCGRR